MTRLELDENASGGGEAVAQSYAPSWVDRVTDWAARLPVSSWFFYLGLGLLLLLLQGAVLWIEGVFSFPTVHRGHLFLAAAIPFFLALVRFLDERAGLALAGMGSALEASAEEFCDLRYRLTTLPAGPTLVAGMVALGCAFLTEAFTGEPYNLEALQGFRVSANLLRFVYLLCWWVFGAFVYHTVHQLQTIDRIYTEYTRVNLFRTTSLYAFSNLAALTAGGLIVIPYGFMLANESMETIWQEPVVLSVYLVITFFALVTFIWPQLGIHRLQVAEKERLLGESNQYLEATIGELHKQLDSRELEAMSDLNTALLNLEVERTAVEKVSTWPWEPETVRALITALVLPLGLWALQFVLQRLLES